MVKGSNLLSSKNYLWLALVIAMVAVAWIQLPRIFDPNALEEDLRTLYWLHRYQEPDLFPTVQFEELGVIDVQIGSWTFVNETSAPGYSLMFQLVSYLIPPLLFSKLLAFPLMFAAVYYLFRIGEKISDDGTALVLSLAFVVLILASSSDISVLSGLHRAFAVPLTLALVYYLMEKRFRRALIVLFLNGIIYLPSFPVALMLYAFCLVKVREEGRWQITVQWRRLVELSVVVLFVMIAISPAIFFQVNNVQDGIDLVNSEEQHLIENPQFQIGGRRPLFIVFPFIGRGGLTTEAQDGLHLMIMSFFAIIILFLRRSNTVKPPLVILKLLYASIAGFALAWLTILLTSSLLLYLPSRHSRGGLFLFFLIFVVINMQETLRVAVGWVLRKRQQLLWYLLPLVVIAVAFALFLPSPKGSEQLNFRGPTASILLVGLSTLLLALTILSSRRRRQKSVSSEDVLVVLPGRLTWIILGSFVFIFSLFYVSFMLPDYFTPSEDDLLLYSYIETLPKDVLLAGNPCSLDSIPFYGKRGVMFSCERFLEKPQMIMDDLRAYYAADGEQIYSFCRAYGVTHLVVDQETLQPEFVAEGSYFFEPYNSILASELQLRTYFVLNHVPKEQKLFELDGVFVIPCDVFLTDLSAN